MFVKPQFMTGAFLLKCILKENNYQTLSHMLQLYNSITPVSFPGINDVE